MWNDGIRNPLVLVPQADVCQRTASAFNVRWQQLAATDANIRFYNNPDDINFALQGGLSQNAGSLIYCRNQRAISWKLKLQWIIPIVT